MPRGFLKVILAFAALTFVLTLPLSLNPAGRVAALAADTDLFIWTLAWDAHAILSQPLALFDANIYYPQTRTLAYSENLLGGTIFSAPVWWLTGNAVLAMNVAALASCVLCGVGAWLLARRLGASDAAALVAGVIFAFAPPRFLRLPQLHLTLIQWIPFALAFLHSYFDRGRPRDLRLAVAFFSLQALSSGHGAVFLALAALGLAGYRVALGEPLAARRRIADFGIVGGAFLLPAVLVVWPYLAVQEEMQLRRSLADASTWAASAASFLASPTRLHSFVLAQTTDRPINQEAGAYLFPGYLPIVLAAAAFMWSARNGMPRPWYGSSWTRAALAIEVIWIASLLMTLYLVAVGPIRWKLGTATLLSVRDVSRAALLLTTATVLRAAIIRRVPINVAARLRRWRECTGPWRDFWRRDSRGFYVLLLLATLWLSAGPPIGLWPAVYWLPGLNFIRVASRFTLLGVLCLAILAAFGFDRWTARLPDRRRTAAGVAAAVFLMIEFAAIPLETFAYRIEPPAADVWLASRPGPFSVVEVPVPTAHEGGEERRQTMYMLHSMAHWQKTVHGYSGLRPPLHFDLFRQLRFFPDATSLAQLKQLGVDYAVVHVDLYPSGEWPPVEARLAEFGDVLTLEYADAISRVYSIN